MSDKDGREWDKWRESNEDAFGAKAKIEYVSNSTWKELLQVDWEGKMKAASSWWAELPWEQKLLGMLLSGGALFLLHQTEEVSANDLLKALENYRSSVFDYLHDQAIPLAEDIHAKVKDHTGPVVLVGHSHGAWGIRHYLNNYELPPTLETYALGSPVFVDFDTVHFVHQNDLIPIIGPFRENAKHAKIIDLGEFPISETEKKHPLAPHFFENYLGPFQEYIKDKAKREIMSTLVVAGVFLLGVFQHLWEEQERFKKDKETIKEEDLFEVAERSHVKRREKKKNERRRRKGKGQKRERKGKSD